MACSRNIASPGGVVDELAQQRKVPLVINVYCENYHYEYSNPDVKSQRNEISGKHREVACIEKDSKLMEKELYILEDRLA